MCRNKPLLTARAAREYEDVVCNDNRYNFFDIHKPTVADLTLTLPSLYVGMGGSLTVTVA